MKGTVRLFGLSFVVYNVHTLLHLTAEVRRLDMPLDKFSAFFAESFFGPILKKVKSGRNAQAQLVQYLQKVTAADDAFELGTAKQEYERERAKGVRMFKKKEDERGNEYYLRCTGEKFTFDATRHGDRFCEARVNGQCEIIKIDRFRVLQNAAGKERCVVEGRLAPVSKAEFFTAPIKASDLGIVLLASFAKRRSIPVSFPLKDLIRKGCCFPTADKERDVFIPLIHDKTIY